MSSMYRYAKSSNQSQYRSNYPLSNETIRQYAPSVMADAAHESRGDRYDFIPTINVLDGLRAEGFMPYEVRQTRVRDQSRREFTKHMVRMRHANQIATQGTEVPEIILINSHDGTSSYQLLSGVFRFVCSNGLIAGDVANDIKVRHSGNVVGDVIEGATRVLDNLSLATDRIAQYKAITLQPEEQVAFARSALQLRWDPENTPIVPASILRPRRHEDVGSDLWRTFNRVQESLVDGGIQGRSSTGRRMSTRAVNGVNENVKLNRALWSLADAMANMKSGVTA